MPQNAPLERAAISVDAEMPKHFSAVGKSAAFITLAIAGVLDAAAKPAVAQSSDPIPVAAVPSVVRVSLRTVIEEFSVAFQRNTNLESALAALEAHEPASTVQAYRTADNNRDSAAGKATIKWLENRAIESKTARLLLMKLSSERDPNRPSVLAHSILREVGSEVEEDLVDALKNIPSEPKGKVWEPEETDARYAGFGAAEMLSQVLMSGKASASVSASLGGLISTKETPDLQKRLSALTLVKGGQSKTMMDMLEKDKAVAPVFADAFLQAFKSGEPFLPRDPLEAEKKWNALSQALQKTMGTLEYYNPEVVRAVWDGYGEISTIVHANANAERKAKAQAPSTPR